MPLTVYVPEKITEFVDVPVPGSGDDGKALTYNHGGGNFSYVAFEPAGAVSAHVGASDPHDGYLLADGSRNGAKAQAQAFTNGVTTNHLNASGTLNLNPSSGLISHSYDGFTTQIMIAVSDTGYPTMRSLRARGSTGAETATQSGDVLGLFTYRGYNGTAYTGSVSYFGGYAAENFSSGATGADVRFFATRTGAIFPQERLRVSGDGVSIAQSVAPTARLDVAASNSSFASLRLRAGANVTSSNDGDLWYLSAGRLQFRRSSTTEVIASGVTATGGAATATGTYGATEQAMLQVVYDAARNFGLLT